MTTLDGLPRLWDSFIQGICARKKLITFSKLWEECTQEEAQLITREEEMGATEEQALIVHTRRNHRKKKDHHHNKGRTLITKYKINSEDIYLVLDDTHVMRRDTTPEIVPETKDPPTRILTRKDSMLTQLNMMNQQGKKPKNK